jgi:hypothetical protein
VSRAAHESRPGLAVAVLGLLGLLPPTVTLAPQIAEAAAPVAPVSRPDVAEHETEPHA